MGRKYDNSSPSGYAYEFSENGYGIPISSSVDYPTSGRCPQGCDTGSVWFREYSIGTNNGNPWGTRADCLCCGDIGYLMNRLPYDIPENYEYFKRNGFRVNYPEAVPMSASVHKKILDFFGGKSGGCYLTTACVDFAGLSDSCELLVAMRELRDDYVVNQSNGKELIAEYYTDSPKVVTAINQRIDYAQIYEAMLIELTAIKEIVRSKNYENAASAYTSMYLNLQAKIKS